MTTRKKKLIEVALPLEAINTASASEKSVPRRGHPQTIHLWWARRPLAAARAILFAQLVDDPSSCLERFPSESEQHDERARLFRLIERLAAWENVNDEAVLAEARMAIARSWASDIDGPFREKVCAGTATNGEVLAYLASALPPICDPFSGGGSIALEAQRLGLRALASDLNPVAVTINKALLELPLRFRNRPPVSPAAKQLSQDWTSAQGLAADIRAYADWMLHEARRRLAPFYPEVALPKDAGGGKALPIGWIWARTVASPNPALKGTHVPLVASFCLSNKRGREVWIVPEVTADRRQYSFRIQRGGEAPALTETVNRTGARCLLSGEPIPFPYIRGEAQAHRLGARLLAVVVEGARGREYLNPQSPELPDIPEPEDVPATELPAQALGFRVQAYGMTRHRDLFSPRQLLAMCTFAELVHDARERVMADALAAGMEPGACFEDGGASAAAYADAVALCLALGVGRLSDYNSTICTWNTIGGSIRSTFSRQAIPITWDYYETNPLADTTGSWSSCISWVADAVDNLHPQASATAYACDAKDAPFPHGAIISTDPPYYDNIGYSDLSDYFYVWLRKALLPFFGRLYATVLVPKVAELVANPFRFKDGRREARAFFETGLAEVFKRLYDLQAPSVPLTVYYAFKQAESTAEGDSSDDSATSSTGWETFLHAVVSAGFSVDGTWPIRTERAARTVGLGTNALASSVVLVCHRRPETAPSTTRGEFRRTLRRELPEALKKLQQGNIAPVDVAQAAIGPGMAVFSRHREVLEANGKPMTIRGALQLINEVLDEYLASGEGDFDADTRFAITWYEQHGWEPGAFGDAETLAKARNVSVAGVVEAGICHSAAGRVRILKRAEMRPLDYDPQADKTPTVWEFAQHMIRYLEEDGEEAAARLLKRLGSGADATRELAYRLFNTCERKKWAEDARSYNALILAWPELEKLAAKLGDEPPPAAPSKSGKKAATKKKTASKNKDKQQELFEGDDE